MFNAEAHALDSLQTATFTPQFYLDRILEPDFRDAIADNPNVGIPPMPFDLRGAGVLSTAITGNICTANENDLNDKGVDLDTKEEDIDFNNALAEWT